MDITVDYSSYPADIDGQFCCCDAACTVTFAGATFDVAKSYVAIVTTADGQTVLASAAPVDGSAAVLDLSSDAMLSAMEGRTRPYPAILTLRDTDDAIVGVSAISIQQASVG